MTHDPDIYEDPSNFNPGRFLGENGNPAELDPGLLVFGFGRRYRPSSLCGTECMYTCAH